MTAHKEIDALRARLALAERVESALRELIEVAEHPDSPHTFGMRARLRDAHAALAAWREGEP